MKLLRHSTLALNADTCRFGTGPVVSLVVGDDKTCFTVHRDLLCEASSFFKAAFMGAGEFKETSEQSMSLPEDNADTFELLVKWLYRKSLSDPDRKLGWETEYFYLARLDILADKYDITGMRNDIIDALFECEAKNVQPPSQESSNSSTATLRLHHL